MNVGYKIKKLRKLHRLTQKDLADRIGSSPSAISRYENDKRCIPIDTLQKIASVFSCDFNYFYSTSNNKYTFVATNLDSKSYHQFILLKQQLEQNNK